MFSKIDVKGTHQSNFFNSLKAAAGGIEIDWNFGKFLISPTGEVQYFKPAITPNTFEEQIKKMLEV